MITSKHYEEATRLCLKPLILGMMDRDFKALQGRYQFSGEPMPGNLSESTYYLGGKFIGEEKGRILGFEFLASNNYKRVSLTILNSKGEIVTEYSHDLVKGTDIKSRKKLKKAINDIVLPKIDEHLN